MGVYTHLNSDEIQSILDLYNLGELKEYQALSHGISNSNFSVETQKRRVLLKVSNDKNESEIRKEMELLLALNEAGFRYSLSPLSNQQGELVYQYGQFTGVIFPFAEGEPPEISHKSCRSIGQALAKLHLIPFADFPKSIRNYDQIGFNAEMIEEYIQNAETCPQDFKDSFHDLYPEGISHILESARNFRFPKALIHGDLYYDNTLFKDDELTAILDFEQAGIGNALLDIGISISGTCLKDNIISQELVDSYLEGYEELRPLTNIERIFFQDSIIIGLFSIALWRIKRFLEKGLDPSKRESYKELIERAIIYKKSLI